MTKLYTKLIIAIMEFVKVTMQANPTISSSRTPMGWLCYNLVHLAHRLHIRNNSKITCPFKASIDHITLLAESFILSRFSNFKYLKIPVLKEYELPIMDLQLVSTVAKAEREGIDIVISDK